MSQNRSALLSKAFTQGSLSIGALTLRAPTAGSIDLLQQIKNPLFAEVAEDGDPVGGEILPLFEFIWVHSAPIDEVLSAAEIEGQIRREAQRLAFETPLEDVAQFTAAFQNLQTRLQAAMTEAIPEDGDQGKPVTSPTGSPSLSSTSAGQGTGPGSDTSSGNSRLIEPSSISTRPSDTTAPPADSPAISTTEETPTPTLLPPLQVSPDDGL